MIYVLVSLCRGLIKEIRFYYDEKESLRAIDAYVKKMNPEDDDAELHSLNGMVTNAKRFLDNEDRYDASVIDALLNSAKDSKPIYVIGNPGHFPGFMIASFDEPMGYTNPAEAVSDLGVLREMHGKHLKLFRLIPVTGPIIKKKEVIRFNTENEIEDFDPLFVDEYLS